VANRRFTGFPSADDCAERSQPLVPEPLTHLVDVGFRRRDDQVVHPRMPVKLKEDLDEKRTISQGPKLFSLPAEPTPLPRSRDQHGNVVRIDGRGIGHAISVDASKTGGYSMSIASPNVKRRYSSSKASSYTSKE
jgi:hypothetical protein